jgi:hypothetical protein
MFCEYGYITTYYEESALCESIWHGFCKDMGVGVHVSRQDEAMGRPE